MNDDEQETYMKLVMVANIARGILARYFFDNEEEMAESWRQLALWLASLPEEL